jgi:hypothetical protein
MAQCSATISYQNNPNSPTSFWADNLNGVGNTSTFTWDFGDGSYGSGLQTSHYFVTNGLFVTYNVCLTISDSATGCGFTTCRSITFPDTSTANNCSVLITYTNSDSLYAFAANAVGTAPYSYIWTVDGQTLSSANGANVSTVINSLTNTNQAAVCVSVTDAQGCESSNCVYISNANQPNGCNVYATYTNQDSLYTFFASTTDGTPVSYEWFIDNNLMDTTASFSIIQLTGTHDICLNVLDADGSVCSDCINLTITPGVTGNTCQAYFVIYPLNANGVGGGYYGYNYSSPNQNLLWDFGDGNTSTDPFPTHTYAQPGNYIVCLTVGFPNTNCYDTYCDSSFYVFKTEGGLMSQLSILSPTGIEKTQQESNLNIYPNPAKNSFAIVTDRVVEKVTMMNLQGQSILEMQSPNQLIDIEKLATGIYLVEAISGNNISRAKLVKD